MTETRPTRLDTQLTADVCIKCNICTAACPVAAVTDLFPGPKTVGPQAQRFRAPGAVSVDRAVGYCSGCGTCTRVCPHGVQIAEMNVMAKAAMVERDGLSLRNRMLGRSELLGQVGSLFAPVSTWVMQLGLVRIMLERVLGISRGAALPGFARVTFRRWFKRQRPAGEFTQRVAYFHGCSTNYYEPHVGRAAVRVLWHNGCAVSVPPQNCCGLPLQSNGEFAAARQYAWANLKKLLPVVQAGEVIVGTSSSCILALKHEYQVVLGLPRTATDWVAGATYDYCEFLQKLRAAGRLQTDFRPLRERILYHAPCQLRSHGIGSPALELLRLIPGLTVVETQGDCCGVAGTYGMKVEKYKLAQAVGRRVFDEARAAKATRIACDSETCRWWLQQHTGLPAVHPVEILAEAYGLTDQAAGGR